MNDKQNASTANIEVDLSLLNGVARVLEEVGFTVKMSDLTDSRVPWVLAENGLFALGIIATRGLHDLITLESYATQILTERIRGAGPKRWDTYLLLLAREDRYARGTQAVRELQYDTSSLRRMVNLGIDAGEESVRRALRPFLPLPAPSSSTLGSTLDNLLDELVLQGIDRERATKAMLSHHSTMGA